MEENKELEELKARKLREMLNQNKKDGAQELEKVIAVNDTNFRDVINNASLAVIDCWASWCMPCRMLSPIIDELANDYAGKVVFGKLNVEENRQVPIEYQIMSIPTILVFKKGQLVDRIVGALPKRILESKITQHL